MKIPLAVCFLLVIGTHHPAQAKSPKPRAAISSHNYAEHMIYYKDGNTSRAFGVEGRIGVSGILGGSRPQFLNLYYSDGNTIKSTKIRRGGTVDLAKRMQTNAMQLAKVFKGMGRTKLASALKTLSKTSPKAGSPYRGAGVSFGGIWTDPSLGMRLPSGDSLYFKLEGKGWRSLRGHPRLRLSYGLSRVNGIVDSHSVVLHHTTNSPAQQKNNAKKLNQALDYLEAQLGSALQP